MKTKTTGYGYIVGKRVQIPAYMDNWMRGDQYGVVTSVRKNYDSGIGIPVAHVKGDKGTKTRLKLIDLMKDGEVLV